MNDTPKPKFDGEVYANGAVNLPRGVRQLFDIGPGAKYREFDATIEYNVEGVPVIVMTFKQANTSAQAMPTGRSATAAGNPLAKL